MAGQRPILHRCSRLHSAARFCHARGERFWSSPCDPRGLRKPPVKHKPLKSLNSIFGRALSGVIYLSFQHSTVPISGIYVSNAGAKYTVSSTGPTALAVSTEDRRLCLQFWKDLEPKIINGYLKLRGQTCKNRTFEDLRWTAFFKPKSPNKVTIYSPSRTLNEKHSPTVMYFSKKDNSVYRDYLAKYLSLYR